MEYILPLFIMIIFLVAWKNKTSIYPTFLEGVENGLKTVISIFPVILATTVAVSMMRASGLMDIFLKVISPVTSFLKIPDEILPLALIRPLSGGGALGVLSDILKEYGPDSFVGIAASVIMGSTETTFYTLSVYFKNTRVKYNNHIIPAAVFGDIVGVIVGVIVSAMIF